ncbi:DUF3375 domain-containing protein [Marinobacter sp. Arc7-DN-1]|uniref:DUF3375 domain-containing protein n=1 Tax=Marinobacter sp. Arc7-DN-1 TaxID=2304594 RepID=UPI000E449242|nr:DUF3375 domain-containing protein [Marinobacter sp. Arc7-DN-1]AXS82494.1 DUF3375 domain-containing protein [Marinobacter sp. Arc7-DN-1]
MDESTHLRTQSYLVARHQHPAWKLLSATRGPLVLSCLHALLEQNREEILFEDAQQMLTDILLQHANSDDLELPTDDPAGDARRELRSWIRRGLIIERNGRLIATDALQKALAFAEGLDERIMTSTASRLATVQREIENLETRLNPDARSRADHIRRKIKDLEHELAEVEAGRFKVLQGGEAAEGIREVYNLATSLRADFRRVEDSYRDADRRLRQSIVSEQHHRGEIVDRLLDGHDTLLETSEGKVFHGFHEQLGRSTELENMKQRLRTILRHPATHHALSRQQQDDLRWLVIRLIQESAAVIKARARSERDVKGFLKTGLAAENHRVGELLNGILNTALQIDWSSHRVRRSDTPLPPVAVATSSLPLLERLRFKSAIEEQARGLELAEQNVNLEEVDAEFWRAFDGLDREALFQETAELLKVTDRPMSIADLARHLPPTHDLETVALWLAMAREAEVTISEHREAVDITDSNGQKLRFLVPKLALTRDDANSIDWEL